MIFVLSSLELSYKNEPGLTVINGCNFYNVCSHWGTGVWGERGGEGGEAICSHRGEGV